MKKKLIIFIILLISLISGCSENIYKYKIVQQVALNCLYDYKNERIRIFEDKETGKFPNNIKPEELRIRSCFFLNKDIICISSTKKVYFYSIKKNKLVKILSFSDEWEKNVNKTGKLEEVSSYETIATKKEDNLIFIFCFGKIYEYDFIKDKLELLYEGFDNLFNISEEDVFFSDTVLWGKSAPSYCKAHNSFIFPVVNFKVDKKTWSMIDKKPNIKEFSLNDHKVRDIVKGWRPYVVESKNALYYISEDESKIMEMDLDTYKDKRILLEFDLPIYYFTPNKAGDEIIFIHRTRYKDFKGSYSHDSKLWNEKESKIRNFSHEYHLISSDVIFPEDM
jgi:hypothetical protein